ncbi:hypothetical protein FHS14_002426 [Paenibacillus baekrokdamisoli]|uniref:hypothetical protein n=1 Tax=Paenibacillus baekrokdamisoli TaxID=1712516 RepID=UPI0013E08E23|nr:hypothetical protein [Paenibacillus baekrokdamisoli]MBB3069436.1 hypothetical protein [Paenibacillus baekrokdamisoli]
MEKTYTFLYFKKKRLTLPLAATQVSSTKKRHAADHPPGGENSRMAFFYLMTD